MVFAGRVRVGEGGVVGKIVRGVDEEVGVEGIGVDDGGVEGEMIAVAERS